MVIKTRRDFIKKGLGSLGTLILASCFGQPSGTEEGCYDVYSFLTGTSSGCSGGGIDVDVPFESSGGAGYSTTGVNNLNTPEEIISNPKVSSIVSQMRNKGYTINLERGINPPYIVGTYSISGKIVIPFSRNLDPGTFRWSNQTLDNYIDTDYSQSSGAITSGVSSIYGEIIRGSGNIFTVYSVLKGRANIGGIATCEDDRVLIVDGERLSSGDISARFCGAVVRNYNPSVCIIEGNSGEMYLDKQ